MAQFKQRVWGWVELFSVAVSHCQSWEPDLLWVGTQVGSREEEDNGKRSAINNSSHPLTVYHMQNRILWKQPQQGSTVCVIVASDDRGNCGHACHQCPQRPHLAICLLTQFTAAALQDPLSLVSGHLVSSQLRWHRDTGHHHCARTARVTAWRMGTAPEYELSPPPPPAARLAAPTHSVSGWQDSFPHTHAAQSPIFPGSLPHSRTRAGAAYGHYITTRVPTYTLHIQSTYKH